MEGCTGPKRKEKMYVLLIAQKAWTTVMQTLNVLFFLIRILFQGGKMNSKHFGKQHNGVINKYDSYVQWNHDLYPKAVVLVRLDRYRLWAILRNILVIS